MGGGVGDDLAYKEPSWEKAMEIVIVAFWARIRSWKGSKGG